MLIRLHWDPTAIWRVGINRIRWYVPDSMPMVELHRVLDALGCRFHWNAADRRLMIIPK